MLKHIFKVGFAALVVVLLIMLSPSISSAQEFFNVGGNGYFHNFNSVWVQGFDPNETLNLTFVRSDVLYCEIKEQSHLTEGGFIYMEYTCSPFKLEAGDSVTVTDGTNTKQHTVTSVEVTKVDYDNDIVSGSAKPNTFVNIQNFPEYLPNIVVEADDDGFWEANYQDFDFDLTRCHGGEAFQTDDDWDSTMFNWFPESNCEISDILLIFDDWVDAGDLEGNITGMRKLLELADGFNEAGKTNQACRFLNLVYKKCDGQPEPEDTVTGSAQEELASIILIVRGHGLGDQGLRCK